MSSPENERSAPDAKSVAEGDARSTERSGKPSTKKKRKKKRKHGSSRRAPAAPRRAARDAKGIERPAFLLAFPAHPELDRLVAAFEAGDYASVRSGAPALAERTDDPRVRDAALELWRRIEPDPLIRYLLFASVGLLLFLVVYFYVRRH